MANTIKGKIHRILPVETNEYNGNTYSKQRVIFDCTTYDQFTGEPRSNFPQIEFGGRVLDSIAGLKVGDLLEVSFALNGWFYNDKNTGEEKHFTSIRGYKIEAQESKPRASADSTPYGPPMPAKEPEFMPEKANDEDPF